MNFEIAATALLGALFFGETLGARAWIGIGGVLVAGIVLSWGGGWPGLVSVGLVASACTCWGFDNNVTALIDGMSPSETTLWKPAIASHVNLSIGIAVAPMIASLTTLALALGVGSLCYGASIALYITAAHQEGAVRTQALFAAAPFVGAVLAWAVLHEPVGGPQVAAGVLFVGAIVLLLSDRHEHAHLHEALAHTHRHDDGHHEHRASRARSRHPTRALAPPPRARAHAPTRRGSAPPTSVVRGAHEHDDLPTCRSTPSGRTTLGAFVDHIDWDEVATLEGDRPDVG